MSLNVVLDNSFEGFNEYANCSVTLSMLNPDIGEMEEIASDNDSVCINSD